MKDDEKEKVKNSLRSAEGRRLRGEPLHRAVLAACNVKPDGMSADAVRGAFKTLGQMVKNTKGSTGKVAGARLFNNKPAEVATGSKVVGLDRLRLGGKG
jgi:hypothetical protein